jgi:hypothetical protein
MKAYIGVEMRSVVRFGLTFWMVMLICGGCAGSPDAAKTIPATINTVEPAGGFTKRIAVVLAQTTDSDFGRRVGNIYFRALLDALREEDAGLQLITRSDGQLPEVMDALVRVGSSPQRAFELSETARIAGLNGWACARIESLQPVARKTGILWFRKERYFIFAELSFSVYDPFTGSKIVDKVVETSTPVDRSDYDALRSGKDVSIADFDETIADIGSDIGEHTADVLADQPWQTAVIGVQGGRVFLSAGTSAGLRGGERLAVFQGRRMMDGQNGERFIVPGPEVGMIRIVRVTEGVSEAQVESASGGARIQAGDIAAAVQ